MIDRALFVLTFISALGCGVVAGVFFAFSTFVMKALARLTPQQGIAAMQSINITAINPLFMLVLFGSALTCIAAAALSVVGRTPTSIYLILAGLSYVLGTVVVTILFNVPRNNALAVVDPDSTEGAALWADYLRTWSAWNHVRTISSILASVLLMLALRASSN